MRLLVVLTALGGAAFVVRNRFLAVRVVGDSMTPTIHDGQWVLVRRASLRRVRRGQLVVFAPPPDLPATEGDPPWLVKRAVALPGEAVPDVLTRLADRVPPDRFAVLGDNTHRSYDSRRAGFFPAEALLGVVVRVLR